MSYKYRYLPIQMNIFKCYVGLKFVFIFIVKKKKYFKNPHWKQMLRVPLIVKQKCDFWSFQWSTRPLFQINVRCLKGLISSDEVRTDILLVARGNCNQKIWHVIFILFCDKMSESLPELHNYGFRGLVSFSWFSMNISFSKVFC